MQTTRDKRSNIVRLFVILLVLVVLHIAVLYLSEDFSLGQAAWLTMTTITTVGYGDISPESPAGRISTILLMYLVGIFVLAQIAGEWIDYRIERRDRMLKGLWRWHMDDHIVVLNTPDRDGERYLQVLLEQIRASPSLADCPVQFFTPAFPDGLPDSLRSLGAVHHSGAPEGKVNLDVVDIGAARFVVILAIDADDYRSDSLTLDILGQIQDISTGAYVIAECVLDENRARFRRLGASAVIRPVRAYPELMVRAMAAPGTEEILENLFSHEGAHPRRYNVKVAAPSWASLANALLEKGLGTPLGVLDGDGNVVTNPPADEPVAGQALFVMVDHDKIPELSAIEACVTAVAAATESVP